MRIVISTGVVVSAVDGIMRVIEIHERIELLDGRARARPIARPITRVLVIIGVGTLSDGEGVGGNRGILRAGFDGECLSADVERVNAG